MKIRKFGILYNRQFPQAKSMADELSVYIAGKGYPVYCESRPRAKTMKHIKILSRRSIISRSDMIFAFGGDGTILRVAREIGTKKIPLLGINMGSLGFLAELRRAEIIHAVDHITHGKFEIEKRQRLQVDILRGKKVISSFLALNDAVIQNGEIARVVHLSLSVNNEYLTDFLADGVIASTPTGSTAYSLSANGPIVFPENRSIIITPICPHTLSNRPLVIPDTTVVRISVSEGKKPIVTIDGQVKIFLKPKCVVRVSRSRHPVYLLKTREVSYIHILKEKLGWKGSCYL